VVSPVNRLGNREQEACQDGELVAQEVAGALLATCRRGRQPLAVTLTGGSVGAYRELVERATRMAEAAWWVESVNRNGFVHAHGIVLIADGNREEFERLSVAGEWWKRVQGWPRDRYQLQRSFYFLVSYALVLPRHHRDEAPTAAHGTGELVAAGELAHRFILDRANEWGRVCECGCGLPLAPGRRRYASDRCAARGRKREQRARQRREGPDAPSLDELYEMAARLADGLERYRTANNSKGKSK